MSDSVVYIKNEQKNNKEKTNIVDNINNGLNIHTDLNLVKRGKNIFSKKLLIFVGILAVLTSAILLLTIGLVSKKDKKRKFIPPRIKSNSNEPTQNIITDLFTEINSKDTISSIATIDTLETDLNIIDYESAEKIIGSEKIKDSHELLIDNSKKIEQLISICNDNNFSLLNETIIDLPENLDFLKDTTNGSLFVAKNDLNLYLSSLSDLSKKTNDITKDMNKLLSNISSSLEDYHKELDNMTKQYEMNIEYLSIPLEFSLNQLRNLEIDENLLTKYKNVISDLANNYFENLRFEFNKVKKLVEGVKLIVDTVSSLTIKGKEIQKIVVDVVVDIGKDIFHKKLLEIKNMFIEYRDSVSTLRNEIVSMGKEISDFTSSLKNEEKDILENVKILISQMGNNIVNMIPATLTLASFLDLNKGGNKVEIVVTIALFFLEDKLKDITKFEIEVTTSLDLLFILDVTGSMKPYLEEIKKNIIKIIIGIEDQCPGIDVNLGFIGYRDFGEDYIDIDLTQNHTQVKNIISKVKTSGGKYYYPDEDVAFSLELALKKNWRSNAKLVVFIADAPGHGIKYGGHEVDYSIHPKRREIDEMISELAEKGISLYCLKITSKTDTMYEVFESIYNISNSNNPNFLIMNNKNVDSFISTIIDYAIKVYNEQRDISTEDCLLDKERAIEILKSKYDIDNKNPDDNLRFILGKCNPVLLVPGIYATKLKVELDCKQIIEKEKDITLKNIRIYCGDNLCSSKKTEEYPLLFALLNENFGIEGFRKENYGACLGYIANYFQNENECPKVGDKSICHYSKYIKVGYYGGTTNTLKESRCGVEGITKVVQTEDLLFDAGISKFKKVADSFNTISENLKKYGYREGFSFGAIPNDYRRYLATNNFASEVFKYQINRLYQNTGKPVVIVAHSYGTLLTLTNLLKNVDDKNFLKKIKKFIAMAPPFSGSTKLLDVFLHGNKDFINPPLMNYHIFAQYLQYISLPTIMELRPKSIAARIFTDPIYQELGNAIKDRLEIERDCEFINCDIEIIKNKTEKFDEIFKGYFPSLLDPECEFEPKLTENDETLNRKCFTNIFNVGDCPTIIKESANVDEEQYKKGSFCKKTGNQYFYQGECNDSRRNCLDKMYYSDKCPNPYDVPGAVEFLINRYNKNFFVKKIDKNYFDNHEKIREGVKKSIEHQNEIDLINELPVPPVDTELVYGSFIKTITTLILDDNDFKKEINIFKKGGDNTVQSWSSLLTGLKWIYEKKRNNLPQEIKLIEYCSRLSESGQYKYNQNKEQNFAAISCDCLEPTTNLYKDTSECAHATMLQDQFLFRYIYSIINNIKGSIDDNIGIKRTAAKNYKPKHDYVQECNNDIFNFLNTAK